MELIEDKCFWCNTRITRPSDNLMWICDYESAHCEDSPVAYDFLTLKTNDELAPHQTRREVHEIIKRNYFITKAQRSGKYIREVGENVVMLGKKAQSTSRKSAEKVLPHTGTIRRLVYDSVKSNNDYGYTDYELEMVLRSSHQTVSASRRSLVLDGYLVDSGKTRKNQNNNDCIVWVTVNEFSNGMLFANV
jgi:ribosomal protein L17